MPENRTWTTGLFLIILTAAVGLYLLTLNPARFGSYHDDGIYAVTAKALATGQGYRIVSLPERPAQTKYPPFYPFLLSLIWRASPNFPHNLRLLMLLSVIMTALALVITYAYLLRRGSIGHGPALLIVALMAFNWRVVLLSTSLYSEPTYMVLSLLALWAIERYTDEDRLWLGLFGGTLLGLAFLTRTIGLALVAAAGTYLLLTRQYKKLLIVLAVCTLFIAPWQIWRQIHRPPLYTPATVYYTDYLGDFRSIVGDARWLPSLIGNNLFYLVLVFTPTVCLSIYDEVSSSVFFLPLILTGFALITLGFLRRWLTGVRLPEIYITLYMGMLLLWPYTSYDRFLLPLLPFLLLYMITQAQRFLPTRTPGVSTGRPRALAAVAFTAVLLVLGSFVVYGYGARTWIMVEGQRFYTERARQEQPALAWLREHSSPTDVVLSYRDPMVYLYTERHATRSIFLRSPREFYTGGPPFDPSEARVLLDLIAANHARYLILTEDDFSLEIAPHLVRQGVDNLIAESPQVFTLVYGTPQSFAKIYRIDRVP